MPSYEDALKRFSVFFGEAYQEEYGDDFFGDAPKEETDRFLEQNKGRQIPYPMAWGYVDMFCVSRNKLFEFSRMLGIFSAMNLFVEIAIPTAIVLTEERENVVLFCELQKYECQAFWNEAKKVFVDRYNMDFQNLCEHWDKRWLFVHPVKLSQWKGL